MAYRNKLMRTLQKMGKITDGDDVMKKKKKRKAEKQ